MTLWDARTLQPAGELRGMATTSQALAFSPDGSLLAAAEMAGSTNTTASDTGSVRVWDVRRRALTAVRIAVTSPRTRLQPRRQAARRRVEPPHRVDSLKESQLAVGRDLLTAVPDHADTCITTASLIALATIVARGPIGACVRPTSCLRTACNGSGGAALRCSSGAGVCGAAPGPRSSRMLAP